MEKNENTVIKLTIYVIAIMIIITPLLLRLYEYDAGIYNYAWMSNDGTSIDIFLHCKMIFFIGCCTILAMLFLIRVFDGKTQITISKEFLFLGVYILLTVLSTFTSGYNQFSFSGMHEQFENFWCLLGYVLVVVVVYCTIKKMEHYIFLSKAFIVGAAFIGVIGVSQFFGVDIIMTDFVKRLFAPATYVENLHLTFDRGMVYTTLYNPDYVGLYVALLIPVLLASIETLKDIKWKVFAGADIIFLFISVIGAEALSGIIGVWASMIFYVLINCRRIIANKKALLLTGIAWILAALATVGLTKTSLYLRREVFPAESVIEQQTENSPATIAEPEGVSDVVPSGQTLLNSFIETDEYVEFDYNGYVFREYIYVEDNTAKICFADTNGDLLDYSYDEETQYYTINDSRFQGITSVTCNINEEYIGFITTIDGKDWTFAYGMGPDEKVSYYYYTNFGKIDKSVISESLIIPESRWSMLSGRGFIWAKTFGLLKRHLILGTGADSFTLAFPHNDYAAMYKSGYYENMIISKPHCLYLQCATQTGVLSLICLLIFYLIYFVKSCKRAFTEKIDYSTFALQNAFLASTVGFLVSSLVNDSTICVTPIFCIIIGMALGIEKLNYKTQC